MAGRRCKRAACIATLVAVLAGAALTSTPARAQTDEAKKITDACATYLASVQACRVHYTVTFGTFPMGLEGAPEPPKPEAITTDVAMRRPGEFSARFKTESGNGRVVLDPTTLYAYSSTLNQYMRLDRPADVKSVAEWVMASGAEPAGLNDPALVPMMLLGKSLTELLFNEMSGPDGKAANVTILPPVTVGGVACSAFAIAPGQGVTAEVQIEADDTPTLRRLKVIIDPKTMAAALPEGVEAPKLGDEPVTILDIQVDPWDSSPTFAADEFAFTPPEGAQKVDSLVGKTTEAHEDPSLVGEKAPLFETTLLDGQAFKLEDLIGKKIIVLDFWATWCPYCVKGLPIVMEVVKGFKDQDVVLYAIDKAEGPDKIQPFLKEKGRDVQVALDQDEKIAGLYKVTGIPVTLIIGRDGRIQVHHLGLLPDLKDRLTNEIKRLVAGEDLTTERSAPATGGG